MSVDVRQFDNNAPQFLIDDFFSAMGDQVGEAWTWPSIAAYYSPVTAPPSGENPFTQFGLPYAGPIPWRRGIPSGHAANVPLGRLIGTFFQLIRS